MKQYIMPGRSILCNKTCKLCVLKMYNINAFLVLVTVTELFYVVAVPGDSVKVMMTIPSKEIGSDRKLLQDYSPPDPDDGGDQNRIGTLCSKNDIVIYQGTSSPLPSGIPSYTVQILNSGVSGCSISDIHISCGWFSSARMVNPLVFRRLDYDDCLVNDGEGLGPGEALSFQYASSFQYPMSVSSASCC